MIVAAGAHRADHDFHLTDEEASIARGAVSSLHRADARVYWIDMAGSALVGWAAFVVACAAPPWSLLMTVACVVAILALYRAMAFLHELSHVTESTVPGFALGWNALVGVPLMLPSIVHVGVHTNHHKVTTYGTGQDPEYFTRGGSALAATGLVLVNACLPVLLSVRFLVLAPIGLLYPRFHRALEAYATSLSMNPTYVRQFTDAERSLVAKTEVALLCFWGVVLALTVRGIIPWRALIIWTVVGGVAHAVNAVRTLGAHRYCSDGAPLDRLGQLRDSIDTPGGIWTELWAPVGLRYHALHHFFPGIPYHNLGTAHRRLVAALPPDSHYRAASSRSLMASLATLAFDFCRSVRLR